MAEIGGIAGDRLKSIVERIERLTEEKNAIANDIKEVYSEAKSAGLDVATIRKVVAERKKDSSKRDEQLSLFDIYWSSLGME